jgi:hypothetical protein
MEFIANLIFILHVLIFLFVVTVPFIGPDMLVLMNLVFMLGILVHWICNNNICVLTVIEKSIRGTPHDDQTFFGKLFGGVYTFGKDSRISWWILCFLILFSLYKVIKGKVIQRFIDAVKYDYKAIHRRIRHQE